MERSAQYVNRVQSREDFIAFVQSLVAAYREDPSRWANGDLESFLDGLAAWVADMDGYYANVGQPMPAGVDWRVFAQILAAATSYE